MDGLVYLKDVVTLELAPEKCIGCGLCTEVCPRGVFSMGAKRVTIARRDHCMECGACAMNCPTGALAVEAGVGCAQAIINSALGREDGACCCIVEPKKVCNRLQEPGQGHPPPPSCD